MAKPRIARTVVIAALVLAALTAVGLYSYERNKTRPLVLSGTIEAHTVGVGSLAGGRVLRLMVEEGDKVVPGQPIALLETDTIDRQIAEQEAVIAASRAQLEKALRGPRSEEIERAAAVYENAERERRRLEALVRSGVISRQQYDDAATRARTAAKDLELLREGTRSEDIATARAQLARDLRRLETLRENRSESEVTASVRGTVQSVSVRPGDIVAPNQSFVEIVEVGELWVRVFVPEPELGHVKLGAPASVRVDTFPDRTFSGKVVQISEQAEYTPRNIQTRSQRAELVFGVKIDLEPSDALKAGMAADVELHSVEYQERRDER